MTTELAPLTAGLSQAWTIFLTDWDRTLRSANYPWITRYNYLIAAVQLERGTCPGRTHSRTARLQH